MVNHEPNVNEYYLEQIEAARGELRAIMTTQNCAPIMFRLAFHDASTFDAKQKTGGANGSMNMTDLSSPSNKDLNVAVDLCEQVKAKHPKITYADLYQLAGVVAVEVCKGPDVPYSPGRLDCKYDEFNIVPYLDGEAMQLRDVFHKMGFSDQESVALLGSYTLGRVHQDGLGFDDRLTKETLKFDNSIYVELLKGDTPWLVKFSADKALIEDPKFHKFVKIYAKVVTSACVVLCRVTGLLSCR